MSLASRLANELAAEAVAEEFREYAYSVSHDLGAPVRAMVEFSRLLAEEQPDSLNEESKLYLSLIVENGAKLQQMMQGLLDYSRINTSAKPFAETDCNTVVKEALLAVKDKVQSTFAQITIDTLPVVYADTDQLVQLFHALLDNALKFHPSQHKPIIQLSAEHKKRYWQFAISDNGIGMDTRFSHQIFQMFQRLHTDDEYPGVGVGLACAQKITHRHGGELWFESAIGLGSTFYFTLPVKR